MKFPPIRSFITSLSSFALGLPSALAQTTECVSVDSAGLQGNLWSGSNHISSDGRFISFQSDAYNLVPGDTNGYEDAFVHDRQTGQTTRVSVDSAGLQGNGETSAARISPDGRFVSFSSEANNLVPGDTNGYKDAFVHDRQTGQTTRVSVDSAGLQGNGDSYSSRFSSDNRFVIFGSEASNLVPGDTNGQQDLFVHDLQTGQTTRVSVGSGGSQSNGYSNGGGISSDGRFISFNSEASNLVSGDTNSEMDAFVHDRQSGQTTRVSVGSTGSQGNDYSSHSRISLDGRFVTFNSAASNLVSGDTNQQIDVFVHDRQTGQTTRVSVDSGGLEGNKFSGYPAISSDGRFVAFLSDSSNLVAWDTNGTYDVFVHDSQTGQTTRVSVDSGGLEGNYQSLYPEVTSDGRYVVFQSDATNLVPGDTNQKTDVFVHDRGASGPSLAMTGTCPGPVTLTASNCSASGQVAVLYGPTGTFTQPNGACAGLTLGISGPTLGGILTADGSGSASLSFNSPPGACGLTVQAVNVATCTATNTVNL